MLHTDKIEMMILPLPEIVFYMFSSLMILSALMVISVRNPVHSVLFLIFAFFNSAGLFVLLGAEFIAMLMVIVYVGAVAVLFLFIVMMLNIDFSRMRAGFIKLLPLSILLTCVLVAELFIVIQSSTDIGLLRASPDFPIDGTISNTKALGKILYTDYAYAFQISGIILLVAMVGAITLTLRTREGVKKQDINAQVSRDSSSSVELVKVQSGRGV
jgi:NADH-quinone oxidoreductase subunit J